MGCGKYFCAKCVSLVHNVKYCKDCGEVAEDYRGAYEEREESGGYSGPESESEEDAPKYAATGEDAVWESSFDSAQMIHLTRDRLNRIQRDLPLGEANAGLISRAFAHIIDLAFILLVAGGPLYLYLIDKLDGVIPLEDELLFPILMIHGLFAFLYIRLPFTLYGGTSLGKVVTKIRLVDQSGKYLAFFQALVHSILMAVLDLTGLFLINGIVTLFDKKRRSLVDLMLGTQVVSEEVWKRIAQKQIFNEDLSR